MPKPRLLYRDWIVELGRDPRLIELNRYSHIPDPPNGKIIEAVRSALAKLSPDERQFIELFYFRGCSLKETARVLNRKVTRIQGLRNRAVAKLKRELASFVKFEFGIETKIGKTCPLCKSKRRKEIDRLILSRGKRETWRRIIKTLKTEYGINITTPQILIGHRKYHITRGV